MNYTPYDYDSHYLGLDSQFAVTHAPLLYIGQYNIENYQIMNWQVKCWKLSYLGDTTHGLGGSLYNMCKIKYGPVDFFSPVHGCTAHLRICLSSPVHEDPPNHGFLQVRDLYCSPPPQVTLHEPHTVHTPHDPSTKIIGNNVWYYIITSNTTRTPHRPYTPGSVN